MKTIVIITKIAYYKPKRKLVPKFLAINLSLKEASISLFYLEIPLKPFRGKLEDPYWELFILLNLRI